MATTARLNVTAGTSRHMLSQTDLQSGELGPGWPSTYKQYSAAAQAGPGEEPRQVHTRFRASSAGLLGWWPLGPPSPTGVHSAHSLS